MPPGFQLIHNRAYHRSLFGDGVASVIAAFLWRCPPVTTYSENIGIMALTKVLLSVSVVFLAACIAIVISFFAPVNTVITGIPTPVLGGISILLFGIIAITGIRIYMDAHIDFSSNRNTVIALCVIVLGLGGASISFHTGGLHNFEMPSIAVATFTGIFLNQLLPGDRNQLKPVCQFLQAQPVSNIFIRRIYHVSVNKGFIPHSDEGGGSIVQHGL